MPRRTRRLNPWTWRKGRAGRTPDTHPTALPADLRAHIPTPAHHAPATGVGECRWTGKTRHPDERTARHALASAVVARNMGSTDRREVRAYPCDHCAGWHLTSQRVPSPRVSGDGPVSGRGGTIGGQPASEPRSPAP